MSLAEKTSSPKSQKTGWLGQYLALGLIWGASFSFITAGLTVTSPTGTTFWRCLLGALALWGYLAFSGKLPKREDISLALIGRLGLLALLLNVIPGWLFSFAQERVTTITASILNSATPIATIIVMLVAFRDELPTKTQFAGISIGLVGALVGLGVTPSSFGVNDPIGVLAIVVAIFCYGLAIPFSHKYVLPMKVSIETMATFQVSIAVIVLAPVYFFASGALFTQIPNAWVVIQMLLMGIVGTGFAYIWNFNVIQRAGSAIASSVSYPTLLVSLIIGWLALGEPFSWKLPIGAVLVAVGSAVTQWRRA